MPCCRACTCTNCCCACWPARTRTQRCSTPTQAWCGGWPASMAMRSSPCCAVSNCCCCAPSACCPALPPRPCRWRRYRPTRATRWCPRAACAPPLRPNAPRCPATSGRSCSTRSMTRPATRRRGAPAPPPTDDRSAGPMNPSRHPTPPASPATALSVNVNKVALLRNTRHLAIPCVTKAARLCLQAGAQGITVHPRPDERHIRRQDVFELADLMQAWPDREYNIEGNPAQNLMNFIRTLRPRQATFVPDGADQFTSDHGWSLPQDAERLAPWIAECKAL